MYGLLYNDNSGHFKIFSLEIWESQQVITVQGKILMGEILT